MTTTLTPTEQQAVKDAAKEYANTGSFKEWMALPENKSLGFIEGDYSKTMRCFKAGVQWALATLFEPRCVAFAEWCAWNYEQSLTGNKWLKRGANPVKYYTTSELYSIYNEQLNKQQDGSNGNS